MPCKKINVPPVEQEAGGGDGIEGPSDGLAPPEDDDSGSGGDTPSGGGTGTTQPTQGEGDGFGGKAIAGAAVAGGIGLFILSRRNKE